MSGDTPIDDPSWEPLPCVERTRKPRLCPNCGHRPVGDVGFGWLMMTPEIVAKVDELMALVNQLEAQLTDYTALANRLMEAVVAELTAAA